MALKTPNRPAAADKNPKLAIRYTCFENLIAELQGKDLPEAIVAKINTDIEKISGVTGGHKELSKQLRKSQRIILQLLAKELKLVSKGHYRNQWMAVGMGAFGVPLGVAFGVAMDNLGLLGIGIPIGMAIGIGVGTRMDTKAKEAGLQLEVELKG